MSSPAPLADAMPDPPDDSGPSPIVSRRDALPPWVILLLFFFLVMRVAEVVTQSYAAPAAHAKRVDNDSLQDLIKVEITAKTAYGVTLQPDPIVSPQPMILEQALAAADQLQTDTDNSPGAARRVILLRAALGRPPLAIDKNHLDPLAAFTTALPAETPPVDRTGYAAEGQLWKTAFGGPLTPNQTEALAAQIRALPNIRWWRWLGLSDLYKAQHDLSEANRYAQEARARALLPLVSTGLVTLFRLAVGFVGLVLLIYFCVKRIGFWGLIGLDVLIIYFCVKGLVALGEADLIIILIYYCVYKYAKYKAPHGTDSSPEPWPTLPERQPFSERRLGAGDLAAVFVLYLVARGVIELALTGFSGFGSPHLLAVPGLLTPFKSALKLMPALQRGTVEVVLEAVTYLLSAVPPLLYLRSLARRGGASLADELGWTTRSLWPNIGYGFAGFGLAMLLMVVVMIAGRKLLSGVPAPSNPVIPEMVNSSGFWATALLAALACIAAPLIEELLFRGVFYNAVKLRLGVWPAIVLTGLVFGFVHPVGVAEMLQIAVLGGVFAWMAETRKSLVPGITGHFLLNSTTTILLLFALAG